MLGVEGGGAGRCLGVEGGGAGAVFWLGNSKCHHARTELLLHLEVSRLLQRLHAAARPREEVEKVFEESNGRAVGFAVVQMKGSASAVVGVWEQVGSFE